MGIAWYTNAAQNYQSSTVGPRPALYKTQSPPTNDFNFKNLCNNTETYCVLAHIRATSGSVVASVNSHPFVFGRHVFMHNGVVSSFTEIRRDMMDLMTYDAYANVLGSTDSEHVAALFMTNLTGSQPPQVSQKAAWELEYPLELMLQAMNRTIVQILELQNKIMGSKKAPNSLNFCVTDGKKLVATRFRNHETQQPPSLYWSEFAGRNLNSKYPGNPDNANTTNETAVYGDDDKVGKHTIIASEPTTYDESEWHLIGKNCALTVDEKGTETEVPIQYDPKLNAVDPNA